jgi:hypothetical protein
VVWLPTWIGRSPVLATVTSVRGRPAFNSMSPSPVSISPGIMLLMLQGCDAGE